MRNVAVLHSLEERILFYFPRSSQLRSIHSTIYSMMYNIPSTCHTSIFKLIELEAWDVLEQTLDFLHHNASNNANVTNRASSIMSAINCDGMTPLHLIVSKPNVPQSLVLKFIFLHTKSLYKQSKSFSIPLHYACETGSAMTVRTLLECMCSTSNPFFSVQSCTKSLDINERSPLERAWLAYLTANSTAATNWSSTQGFCTKDKHHDYDSEDDNDNDDDEHGHDLIEFHDTIAGLSRRRRKRKSIGDVRFGNEEDILTSNFHDQFYYSNDDLIELWTKTELILYASNKLHLIDFDQRYQNSSKKWYILHEIARSGTSCWCPNIVMWFGIHILGLDHQLSIYNDNGDLPLHVCAKSPIHKILYIPRTNRQCPMMNMSVMEILIKSFPDASLKRSKKGKMLPLHLAILSGKKEKDGINELLKSNPNALCELEETTMLYPFLLSALTSSSSSLGNNSGCLELTFQLLRRNPSLLSTEHSFNDSCNCETFAADDNVDLVPLKRRRIK